jgi:hypothetical protein
MSKTEADTKVPDEFEVSEFEARAVRDALALLKRHGAEPSAFRKHAASARRAAWAAFLVGGAVSMLREVGRFKRDAAELRQRAAAYRARAQERQVGECESAAARLEARVVKGEAVLAAVPEADRIDYRARIASAQARLEAAAGDGDRYRRARLPVPPELEERLTQAEDALTEAQSAWDARRARFEAHSSAHKEQSAAALRALLTTLTNFQLAQATTIKAAIVRGGATVARFPSRLAPEAIEAYRVAVAAGEIRDRINGSIGAGMGEFWAALDEDAAGVLREALEPRRRAS